MKKVIGILLLVVAFQASAQSNSELLKHYESYYAQMKKQGDMQGVINALTHLHVLSPNKARLDTLAVSTSVTTILQIHKNGASIFNKQNSGEGITTRVFSEQGSTEDLFEKGDVVHVSFYQDSATDEPISTNSPNNIFTISRIK